MRRRLHLLAPAAPCTSFFRILRESCPDWSGASPAGHLRADAQANAGAFLTGVQRVVGSEWEVTADVGLLTAPEDDARGGRSDDAARAAEFSAALADDDVAAIVTVRGGAWMTRLLPRIDFAGLDRRRTRVWVFGFSELTGAVNIIAAHPGGVGVYDMGPAFLPYGLRRQGLLRTHRKQGTDTEAEVGASVEQDTAADVDDPAARREAEAAGALAAEARAAQTQAADRWVEAHLGSSLRGYFEDVARMVAGGPSARPTRARWISGRRPADGAPMRIVGGNLTVLMPMLASRWRSAFDPAGRWLLIEDLNEKPERIDRMLAALTLTGFWQRCAGLLLGDFHRGENDLTAAVAELLPYHLPAKCEVPVLVTTDLGHVWPMSPLLLNRRGHWTTTGDDVYSLHQAAVD